jgi:hypothetical protein
VETGRLAVSGILFQQEASQAPAGLPQGSGPGQDATGGAARRIFRRGSVVFYGYEIINARTGASRLPELEVQTRMFHNGEQVLVGKKTVLTTDGDLADPQRPRAGGRLTLGREMAPGEYVLQVIVTDRLAKGKFATVAQSTDFEIAP